MASDTAGLELTELEEATVVIDCAEGFAFTDVYTLAEGVEATVDLSPNADLESSWSTSF